MGPASAALAVTRRKRSNGERKGGRLVVEIHELVIYGELVVTRETTT